MLTGSIVQGMAITVPIGVPLFFIAALVTGNLAAVAGFSPTALAALAAAGIMHFVWGRYCNYRATRAIGTNLVAPIQQFNLLITLALAIWLLGEYLTPLKILGIALILLGPTFTMQKKKAPAAERAGLRREDHADRRREAGGVPAEICRGLYLRAAVRRSAMG